MRAFIAIDIPAPFTAGIEAVQARLKGAGVDASWPRPEGMHLTLKFLGEIGEERVPGIMRSLAAALDRKGLFALRIEGVGAFPSPASARVVWLGVSGETARLAVLQRDVEQAMAELGFAPDGRPYTPHLTIGRIKRIRRRAEWSKALAEVANVRLPEFAVPAVGLFQSELRPTGAVYRELGRAALQSGAAPP